MKLPIPFLLYVLALGLFGLAGWTVYEMLPMWKPKVREDATRRGQDAATSHLTKGRSQGPRSTAWIYGRDTMAWWAGFKAANLIGKPPPEPVVENAVPDEPPPPPPVDVRPLEEIIELIGLVYDGSAGGKGGNSHVIVRFKPEANVEPPEWWMRENAPPDPAAMAAAAMAGRDRVPPPRGRNNGPARPAAPPPMPVSSAGREHVQRLWVDDGGDPRRSHTLWTVKAPDGRSTGTIRLVGVSSDAQVAYWAREIPAAKAGDPPKVEEESLIKTTANLDQALLRQLRVLQGRDVEATQTAAQAPVAAAPGGTWVDVEETTRVNDRWNIGREDDRSFRENPDAFLEQLNFDTYVSSNKSIRGLVVKGLPPKVSSRFGVQVGDVLIEINGKRVDSRTHAYSVAKKDYERGVRTFSTKWHSNGQLVDRVYQVPDK